MTYGFKESQHADNYSYERERKKLDDGLDMKYSVVGGKEESQGSARKKDGYTTSAYKAEGYTTSGYKADDYGSGYKADEYGSGSRYGSGSGYKAEGYSGGYKA